MFTLLGCGLFLGQMSFCQMNEWDKTHTHTHAEWNEI